MSADLVVPGVFCLAMVWSASSENLESDVRWSPHVDVSTWLPARGQKKGKRKNAPKSRRHAKAPIWMIVFLPGPKFRQEAVFRGLAGRQSPPSDPHGKNNSFLRFLLGIFGKKSKNKKNAILGVFGPGKSFLGRFGAQGKKNVQKYALAATFWAKTEFFKIVPNV